MLEYLGGGTLADRLAKHYETVMVGEFARTLRADFRFKPDFNRSYMTPAR